MSQQKKMPPVDVVCFICHQKTYDIHRIPDAPDQIRRNIAYRQVSPVRREYEMSTRKKLHCPQQTPHFESRFWTAASPFGNNTQIWLKKSSLKISIINFFEFCQYILKNYSYTIAKS